MKLEVVILALALVGCGESVVAPAQEYAETQISSSADEFFGASSDEREPLVGSSSSFSLPVSSSYSSSSSSSSSSSIETVPVQIETCVSEYDGSSRSYNAYIEFCDTRDGKVYTYKKIGEKTWMTQNLAYTIGASDDCNDLPFVYAHAGVKYSWVSDTSSCEEIRSVRQGLNHLFCYNDYRPNCDLIGVQYSWYQAHDRYVRIDTTTYKYQSHSANVVENDSMFREQWLVYEGSRKKKTRGVCPIGWHLPVSGDIETLVYDIKHGHLAPNATSIYGALNEIGFNAGVDMMYMPGGELTIMNVAGAKFKFTNGDPGIDGYNIGWDGYEYRFPVEPNPLHPDAEYDYSSIYGMWERYGIWHLTDVAYIRCVKDE